MFSKILTFSKKKTTIITYNPVRFSLLEGQENFLHEAFVTLNGNQILSLALKYEHAQHHMLFDTGTCWRLSVTTFLTMTFNTNILRKSVNV